MIAASPERSEALPTTTGSVTTTGTVGVTVPPVSVAPVQILGPVAP